MIGILTRSGRTKRVALLACVCFAGILPWAHADTDRKLDGMFSPAALSPMHADVSSTSPGAMKAVFWKGYATTGFEVRRLPVSDWSAWKSFRFDVDNPYREPFSVYVRISGRPDHPASDTYTGGTFDGFVIGPGRNTVEISLENMSSPDENPVDARNVSYLGIFFQPLFLRDGMDLKFTEDKTFVLSNPRLSSEVARRQKQPYGDLLFGETVTGLAPRRTEAERAISDLQHRIEEAKAKGVETVYAEIYPFLAELAFRSRLVAFWQDRAGEQRRALDFLVEGARTADRELKAAIDGNAPGRSVPPIPRYADLAGKDGYFRQNGNPVLLFGMLYNRQGPLLRWFANSQTDYGTQLVAGATRHDVERQPIWEAYHKYPDTHRVGWDHADHIIRDRSSWEVLGDPVSICLESPHTREAIAKRIETFERSRAGDRDHLVQNLGFEYTYVCYCDYTKRMWQDWLRQKHGDIAAANRIWGTQFDSFAAVPMPRQESADANRALWFDWATFNLHRFIEQIRWTRDEIRRWEPSKPLTVGSPFYAFHPAFWTAVDEEELADSGITGVVLEENYELDSLMPEYLHALAGAKPVMDFEYHGVINQILPSFLHGDAAISMWWWNDRKQWTPNEPINEWASSLPQSYTIPLSDIGKAMRDALDLRRLGREIAALGSAPRPVALLYSKTSMLQVPARSREMESFPYLSELRRIYNASQSAGLYLGLTTEKKILAGELRQHRVLVIPGAEFVPGPVSDAILRWAEEGGTVVVSPDSLLSDEYGRHSRVPESLGLRLTRRIPPQLKRGESFVTPYNLADAPRLPLRSKSGASFTAGGVALRAAGARQVIDAGRATAIANFEDGSPALLRLARGRGAVYWLTSPLEPESWGPFLDMVAEDLGLKPDLRVTREGSAHAPEIEYRVTTFAGRRLAYLYNDSDREVVLALTPAFPSKEIIDRRTETPLSGSRFTLPPRETAILEFR